LCRMTSLSAAGYGKGRKSVEWIAEKTKRLAKTQKLRVSTAVMVNCGEFSNLLTASFAIVNMKWVIWR
jgi:hypothetical protein